MSIVLPSHIGFIMDGNGRWATSKGLSRSEGHIAGADTFRRICEYGCDLGIKSMTFYAFSTENWKRPPQEVAALMNIFRDYLHEAQERKAENEHKGMHMHYMGEREGMPQDILDLFDTAESESSSKTRTVVNIAVNYGGRAEILHSVKNIAQRIKDGELNPEDITEDMISNGLYTAGQPEPDIIVRPSGEQRISNFMIWQSAYSEFWYTDKLWPDFTTDDFDKVIEDYSRRHRRFGGV
ncbi:MAG: di-trans,poly-cis-decaprenylcistransferase [Clostridia bacterium]|nr:di-trans,poly-cis-decaprenylcistransferase [Clostridia bacterium]